MLDDLRFRLRALLRGRQVNRELDDELRFHVDHEVEKLVASGLGRQEALRRARMALGGLDQVREECQEARGVRVLETLVQDIRYGLRTLRRSPGFAFAALLTLACGIGANTAIFSLVYGVLLRPLPYRDPARLVVLNETTPMVGLVSVSYPNFLDWRAQSHSFAAMSAVTQVAFNLAGVSQPESISGDAVSPGFLSMMGVRPIVGRDFTADEEHAGAPAVVLLSYDLWQSHFGGDRDVPGRTISLDGRPVTVVGVLPADYLAFDKTDVIEPIGVWAAANPDSVNSRGDRGDSVVVGRLAPGATIGQARAEMEGIAARLAQAYPTANSQCSVSLQPIRDVFVSDIRPAVLILSGAVVCVLLIACANVANLLLMRGAGRAREMALRMALGASRGRVVRQLLAESLVLACLGGLQGVAVAFWGIRGIVMLVPTGALPGTSVSLNGVVLLFAAGVAILSTCLFGLAPARHSAKASARSALRDGGRSATAANNRWRGLLVVAEVSLALMLLVGAGLMMKSVSRLLAVDPGFRPDHLLTLSMSLRTTKYQDDKAVSNFWHVVLDRVRSLPGVEHAALGTVIPMTGSHNRTDITFEGMAVPSPGAFPHPDVHVVSPEYVSTLGLSLLRGRTFTDADRHDAPPVAMVNARIVRTFFDGGNPVGRRFIFGHPSPSKAPQWVTIVGVVGDTKLYGLANPSRLELYVPFDQAIQNDMNLVTRSANDPAAETSAIRQAVASIDRDQPVFAVATMTELVNQSVAARRVTFELLGWFSALALVLATVGIYGVMSYSVAQRTREIGIRVALGASRWEILRLVIAQGAAITGAGVAVGVLASLGLTRLLAKLLFSVSAVDPGTFVGVALLLAAVAMIACYLPSRRLLRVNPTVALREE
jgi:putative ABC transport system permease protein